MKAVPTWTWIVGAALTGVALFVLFVVLPIRRALRYFEDEE